MSGGLSLRKTSTASLSWRRTSTPPTESRIAAVPGENASTMWCGVRWHRCACRFSGRLADLCPAGDSLLENWRVRSVAIDSASRSGSSGRMVEIWYSPEDPSTIAAHSTILTRFSRYSAIKIDPRSRSLGASTFKTMTDGVASAIFAAGARVRAL